MEATTKTLRKNKVKNLPNLFDSPNFSQLLTVVFFAEAQTCVANAYSWEFGHHISRAVGFKYL